MPSGVSAGTRAAAEEAAISDREDNEDAHTNVAADQSKNRPPGWFRRLLKRCKPRGSSGWSGAMSWGIFFLIPIWFFVANWWNPHYTPIRPWVWMLPPMIFFVIHIVLTSLIMTSAGDAEGNGLRDILLNLLSFMSMAGTTFVVVTLSIVGWWLDRPIYHLGGFQVNMIVSGLLSTAGTFWLSGGNKWYINRRMIANVGT